ncbi:MAG: hydrogenase expression/formation protein HypE [Candidatus Omnitrophica bacterium]|nr:hydrogenase expression/formation protein HypE [Candidatus Omnitrophota bacterium]
MSEGVFPVPHCPVPPVLHETVQLAHGGGGKLMRDLIEGIFIPAFKNSILESRHDAAEIRLKRARAAFTTDTYVVRPVFFPGGDIGSLAVYGTVNDLAMSGARPLYLSSGFILEEGFPMESLRRIVESMRRAAERASVALVTGDIKVVDKGKGDGVFINTAGVGIIEHELSIMPQSVAPEDVILLSGDLGRHGLAVMGVREGLRFEGPIESDSAPVADLILRLLGAGIEIHCARDLTRGGLASALNEIASVRELEFRIEEKRVPVTEAVRGACEILGLDPFYVANEGRFVLFVSRDQASHALRLLKEEHQEAAVIGEVRAEGPGQVVLKTVMGTCRVLDLLSGEQLPRIC